jgi:hypothetical protein
LRAGAEVGAARRVNHGHPALELDERAQVGAQLRAVRLADRVQAQQRLLRRLLWLRLRLLLRLRLRLLPLRGAVVVVAVVAGGWTHADDMMEGCACRLFLFIIYSSRAQHRNKTPRKNPNNNSTPLLIIRILRK